MCTASNGSWAEPVNEARTYRDKHKNVIRLMLVKLLQSFQEHAGEIYRPFKFYICSIAVGSLRMIVSNSSLPYFWRSSPMICAIL